MTAPARDASRARRLLRWYPASWRARYGDEFTELLLADFSERQRCWSRAADVARSGVAARLAAAGLAACPGADPADAQRAALAALACSLAVFLTAGAAMWAQLTIGWQWAAPGSRATAAAMTVMSAAMLAFAALAAAAFLTLAWSVLRGGRRAVAALRGRAAVLAAGGALVLLLGGRHFGNGWPGTGGHWWPHQGLVPGGVAAFAWACTSWISSYWAHPAALAAFPSAEIGWMLASPAAALCLAGGVVQAVRRVPCRVGVRRIQTWLGLGSAACMTVFLSAALCWVTEGGAGPRDLFHSGVIDVAELAVLATALTAGCRALQQVHRAALAQEAR
jgi:hypothetical protein